VFVFLSEIIISPHGRPCQVDQITRLDKFLEMLPDLLGIWHVRASNTTAPDQQQQQNIYSSTETAALHLQHLPQKIFHQDDSEDTLLFGPLWHSILPRQGSQAGGPSTTSPWVRGEWLSLQCQKDSTTTYPQKSTGKEEGWNKSFDQSPGKHSILLRQGRQARGSSTRFPWVRGKWLSLQRQMCLSDQMPHTKWRPRTRCPAKISN
jgi:hypothetical protein